MKPEIALVFWGSGIMLELTPDENIRVTPRPYKRGKVPVGDLEWLRANKAHVIARLRQEGDWRQLGLDRTGNDAQPECASLFRDVSAQEEAAPALLECVSK